VVQIIYARALTVSPHLTEAAEVSSGSWTRNVVRVWIPMHGDAMRMSLFFFVLLSLSEISLAVLLVPPDCMTAAVNIYSMLHYGFEKEVAVETLVVLVAVVALGLLILRHATDTPRARHAT
jgi:ABC-type Fe3+ transport system permease subunit